MATKQWSRRMRGFGFNRCTLWVFKGRQGFESSSANRRPTRSGWSLMVGLFKRE